MIWFRIYLFLLGIGIIIGIIKYKSLNRSNKTFLLLLLITIFSEFVANKMATLGKSNYLVYHIFTPIQYAIIALGYYFDTRSKLVFITIPIMIITSIVFSVLIQPLPAYNSYFMIVELLVFTLLSTYFFMNLLKIETEVLLTNYPLFWISSGLLLFSVSNLFVLGTINFFSKSEPNVILTYLSYFTNYFYYTMYIFAFISGQKTISESYDK
jgi:hypothetical protein